MCQVLRRKTAPVPSRYAGWQRARSSSRPRSPPWTCRWSQYPARVTRAWWAAVRSGHEWLTNHSDGDGVGVGELDGTTGLLKIDRPLGN